MNITAGQIRQSVRLAKNEDGRAGVIALKDGWFVRVEGVRNMPRGGRMFAWKYVYSLLDPTGHSFGGYDRQDSFVQWATKFLKEAK